MIDIVIVNWNSALQLQACVESVLEYGRDQYAQIIIVDNGSTDGSADRVDGLPGVKVIYAGDNLGFAAASNVGAAEGNSPYILFLNPDTKIQKDSLALPLSFMEKTENEGVGVCGIMLFNEKKEISRSCAKFPTLGRFIFSALGLNKIPGLNSAGVHMSAWNHESNRCVDHVIGAFYMIRRNLFEVLKGFDKRFFVYYEDIDLSFRLKELGFDTWYLADARAFHAEGGSSRNVKARRQFYSSRSKLFYAFKHFPSWQVWTLVFVQCTLEPLMRTIWCLVHFDVVGARNTWIAYGMLIKDMKKIIRKSSRVK